MSLSRPVRLAIAATAMLLAVSWVWRFQIANGWTLTFGDRYDAMIEIALLQHWSNVLAGAEAWNVVAWFHPAPDTLGYNDGYLVLGLLHALGRMLGLSLFAAADLAHAILKAAGFVGIALLLRRAGGVRLAWALFGATLFTIADLTLQHADHGQLFTLGFAPWAALAGWAAASALVDRDDKRIVRHGIAFATVFALWISTAYYLAWFFALYVAVLAVVMLASERAWPRGAMKPLLIVAAVGAVLLVPFLIVYLPKVRETGMHDGTIALHTTMWPIDLVNTGPANLVWGWLPDAIRATFAPGLTRAHDAVFGMPPLFLGVTIVAILRAQRMAERRWIGAAGVALLVCWGLMLNLGFVIPWRGVQAIVPGAGGIRVVGRFAILLLLPATFVLTVWLDRMRRGVAMALGVMLLVEQVATSAPVALDVVERTRALAAIPAPPGGCAAFAVVRATSVPREKPLEFAQSERGEDTATERLYAPNVDGMVLASVWQRATINGVSTFAPSGWDFADSEGADYPARVRAYAKRYRLGRMCLLDTRLAEPWAYLR